LKCNGAQCEDRLVIEDFYKFKNYGAKNALENIPAKAGRFLVRISCKEN